MKTVPVTGIKYDISKSARKLHLYLRRADKIRVTIVFSILLLLIVLLCLFVFLFIQDLATKGEIFPGMTIDGNPVGGLSKKGAQSLVSKKVGKELIKPLTVYHGEKEAVLDPASIDLDVENQTMAECAYWTSHSCSIFERMFRRFFKKPINKNIPAIVSYNKGKLVKFVEDVANKFNHEPTNASIDISSGSPVIRASKTGLEVPLKENEELIARYLSGKERRVPLKVKILEPSITEDDIGKIIVIKLHEFQLYLYDRENLINSYIVAIGMPEYPTPTGKFHVTYKQKNPTWLPISEWAKDKRGIPVPPGPDNPLGGYWMDLGGGIGIHATPYEKTLGMAASHGCIRMANWAAEEVFNSVKVGTPVYIIP
ncbi:MAG: L,D-transpeptidase family protein [Actinomycetota bacterium]|nr:L,D-transpeptidase family protein [Actinomycetota bacterium]